MIDVGRRQLHNSNTSFFKIYIRCKIQVSIWIGYTTQTSPVWILTILMILKYFFIDNVWQVFLKVTKLIQSSTREKFRGNMYVLSFGTNQKCTLCSFCSENWMYFFKYEQDNDKNWMIDGETSSITYIVLASLPLLITFNILATNEKSERF